MNINFEFEETDHGLEFMQYQTKIFYCNGICTFRNSDCGTLENLKKLLGDLKISIEKLETFINSKG
jgi:hypothetical protein